MTQTNIDSVFAVAKNKHCRTGEVVVIISRQYGRDWRNMLDSRTQELKEFILNNAFRFYQILESEKHEKIMALAGAGADAYREYYNSHGQTGRKIISDLSIPKIPVKSVEYEERYYQ